MKAITFEQFIAAFNFRDFGEYGFEETEKFGSKIIRIYLPSDKNNTRDWFEFGIYDYDFKHLVWERLERCLSKEVCNSYIETISYNEEWGILNVYLQTGSEWTD